MEILISQTVPTFFMELVGSSTATIRARAVARQGSSTSCMFTLDGSAANSFLAGGGANVQSSCGIVVNSSSGQAMSVTGGARVTAGSAAVFGGYSINGGASMNVTPSKLSARQDDPLAYVDPPPVGSCGSNVNVHQGWGTRTFTPGTYCNGITIDNGATVTFSPGTYVLLGKGLAIAGGAKVSGTDVTFYNTQGSGHNYGAVTIDNGTTVSLSAPNTGAFAGMLFFQDRGITSGPPNTIGGGANTILNGALYFPTTRLDYAGGSTSNGEYTIIVAANLHFTGGTTVNSDYSSLPGGSPIKGTATLSE